ncbi:MAG TPA: PfkB family carbohydrate kinase [Acidobacteriota bacterium]|nr:PfkB family carbohydrate kinase [Acidobacteriota bacterium]
MVTQDHRKLLADLRPWVEAFRGRRVVVWGDLVADRFLWGSTTRVSREAPALVLRYEGEDVRPGAAGNAALNVAALGADVRVFGHVGDDDAGRSLAGALADAGIDISAVDRRDDGTTPVKTRVMAGGSDTVRQQVLRIDDEHAWRERPANDDVEHLTAMLATADALLVSDYGLGTVSAADYKRLQAAAAASNVPVTVDSRHRLLDFPGATAVTPNESEVEGVLRVHLNHDREAIERAGAELLERLDCEHVLITRGSQGMAIFQRHELPVHLPIHGTDEIADVTGAGDTVIATLTLALASGADVVAASWLASVAAGLVVLKHGTAAVPHPELIAALDGDS